MSLKRLFIKIKEFPRSKKILIGILVAIVIFIGWRFIVAPRLFLKGDNCQGKPNGAACTFGVWLDIFGRPCGGQSCVGLREGACLNNKCKLLIPKQEVTLTTDKTEYEQGEEVKAELSFEGVLYEWGDYGWSIQKWEDNSWKDILIKRGCYTVPFCEDANFEEIKECLGYYLCERPSWYKLEKGGEVSWRAKWTWDQTKGEEKSYQCQKVIYDWRGGKVVPVEDQGVVEEQCRAFEPVSPGKYKIRFEYTLNIKDEFERQGLDIKYVEKEFLIKKTEISTPKNCDSYEMPMTEKEIAECTCPEGYEKFNRLSGAYCATDSQKPCQAHSDCPQGESCFSDDGKNWFCSGQWAGCYFYDPEKPEEQICVD